MAKRSYQPKCRATRYNTTRISASQSAVLRAETLPEPLLPLGCPSTALGGAVPAHRRAPPERGRSSPRVGVGGAPASWIMSHGAPGYRSLNPCRTGTRLPSAAISRLPRRCRTHTPCPTHRLAKSPSIPHERHVAPGPTSLQTAALLEASSKGYAGKQTRYLQDLRYRPTLLALAGSPHPVYVQDPVTRAVTGWRGIISHCVLL